LRTYRFDGLIEPYALGHRTSVDLKDHALFTHYIHIGIHSIWWYICRQSKRVRARDLFALKRDWIRGLIFSYAGPDPRLFPGALGPRQLDVSITMTRLHTLYRVLYASFAGVCAVSLVLLAGMHATLPFSLVVGAEKGTLVVAHTVAQVPKSAALVAGRHGATQGALQTYVFEEAIRKDGVLYYRASAGKDARAELIAARELPYELLVAIPLLGVWVQALTHPIGLMALVGVPFTMFALDLILLAGVAQRVRSLRSRSVQAEGADRIHEEKPSEVKRLRLLARIRARFARRAPDVQDDHVYGSGMTVALPRRCQHPITHIVPTRQHRYGI